MLRAAHEPWDGFDALMEHGLETRRRLDHYAAQLCVIAPLPVRLLPDHIRFSDGALAFRVEAMNPALVPHCSVGYVTTIRGAMGERGTLAPTHEGAWANAGENVVWVGVRNGAPAEQVALFARIGPYVVDRTTVVDEGLRVQRPLVSAYESVDPELELLSAWLLSPRKSQQVDFERAVARVLLYCGFFVDSFAGDSRMSDAVDVIAHEPTLKVLLAVECTTGPLQSRDGKLSRLVARAQAIADGLAPEGGPTSDTRVIPVIATSLETVSASDQASADADGIVVLTNQALSSLLGVARSGSGPAAAMALIRERTQDVVLRPFSDGSPYARWSSKAR